VKPTYVNPYADYAGTWLKGNFHAHCRENSGCSSVPLRAGIRKYAEAGFDFVAVTDHDAVTDLAEVRRAHRDMVFMEGFEYSRGPNLLFIGESVPPLYELPQEEAALRAGDLLTVACHPEPRAGLTHWTVEEVLALPRRPDGVEIFNGHYGVERMRANGCNPLYTAFWDALLTTGHRFWGFATDDFHDVADFHNAFSMVLAASRTAAAVLDAARRGRLYGSTGLLLRSVNVEGSRFIVETLVPCTGRFVGPGGTVLREDQGVRFSFTASGEPYVRFEAEGEAGMLWLQPFFLGSPGPLPQRPHPR
jgi:hypothetical protein